MTDSTNGHAADGTNGHAADGSELVLASGQEAGRLRQFYFLVQEPWVLDVIWQIAALPAETRKKLQEYLEETREPATIAARRESADKLVLESIGGQPRNLRRRSRRLPAKRHSH